MFYFVFEIYKFIKKPLNNETQYPTLEFAICLENKKKIKV